MKTAYIPKGSMCAACRHMQRDCSALPFSAMQVIERAPGVAVVRCADWCKPIIRSGK